MVLLALCDNANDQGECYPSIAMIAKKCSMGERTVQGHISDMEKAGIVARDMRAGRSTVYMLNPRNFGTPADSAPPQNPHPAKSAPASADSAPPPPQNSHLAPADSAPITIKESSIESSPIRKTKKRVKKADDFVLPDWVPRDAWDAYVEMRQEIKKVLTEKARPLAISRLDKLRKEGHDTREVLEQSVLHSWQGLFAIRTERKSGADAWWVSDATRLAKAAEVGVKSIPGESTPALESRIRAAIDNGGKPPVPKAGPVIRISDHQDEKTTRGDSAAREQHIKNALNTLKQGTQP